MQRFKNYFRPFLSLKFLLCFLLAWSITNGWAYIFIFLGSYYSINWMFTIGTTYMAFLWLPFTPEKLVTIPLAIWFNLKLFKDHKTNQLLINMKKQAFDDWQKFKNRRNNKNEK